jgi:hypothetical protein
MYHHVQQVLNSLWPQAAYALMLVPSGFCRDWV